METIGLGQEQLERGLCEQRRTGGKLGEILLQLGFVSEAQLTRALAEQLNLAAIELKAGAFVPPAVLARIPATLAHAFQVLPVEYREEERTLVLATAELLKGQRLEELRQSARCWIVPRLAAPTALGEAITAHYGPAPLQRAAGRSTRRAPAQVHALGPRVQIEHPEVSALVKLLLDRGLVTAPEVHSYFREHNSQTLTQQAEVD